MSDSESDNAADPLTQRMRDGDADALAELFAAHRERLWRLVNFRLDRRLSGRVSPDDVLQEAWLDATTRLSHFAGAADGGMSPFVWLRAVVCQTMIDVHRRHLSAKKRDAGRDVSLARPQYAQSTTASMFMELTGHLTSPSAAAVRAESLDAVQQAIESMDPIDREVLALRHFEELGNGEVAEVLGIGEKAASIRYVRAVRRLKEILAQAPGLTDHLNDA